MVALVVGSLVGEGCVVGSLVGIAVLVTTGLAALAALVAAGLVVALVLAPQAVSSAIMSTPSPSDRVRIEKPLIIRSLAQMHMAFESRSGS